MRDDLIPPESHISRYCPKKSLNEDGTISEASFILRSGEEYLSVNWLEFLRLGDRDSEIMEIWRVLSEKLNVRKYAKLGILNVGEVYSHIYNCGYELTISHQPEDDDPSHTGIFGTEQDQMIPALIAEKILESYPFRP